MLSQPLQLRLNDYKPLKGVKTMQVKELKDALVIFNQAMPLSVSVPEQNKPHTVRDIKVVGHIHHPNEVRTDASVDTVDIICDHWDEPGETDKAFTVADFVTQLVQYPDEMHVRVGMPIENADWSHRMLDIVMVGRIVGSQDGAEVQLITESWDFPNWIVKEKPEAVQARYRAVAPEEIAPAPEVAAA